MEVDFSGRLLTVLNSLLNRLLHLRLSMVTMALQGTGLMLSCSPASLE